MSDDSFFTLPLAQALYVAMNNLAGLTAAGDKLVEKHLEEQLAVFYGRIGPPYATSRQASMKDAEGWRPKPGPVDLEFKREDDDTQKAWIEVKWGGPHLWNCIWDVAKMALAVREGLCDFGYLIAGATEADWQKNLPGSEYFLDKDFDTAADVMTKYRSYWLFWKGEVKTRPVSLPRVIRTELVRERAQKLGGPASETVVVRVARVIPVGDEWIDIDEDRAPHLRS